MEKHASDWKEAFDIQLEHLICQGGLTLEILIDFIWEKGIIAQLVPDDPEVRQLRKEKHKSVWMGSKDDIELWWRIYFAAEGSIYAIRHNFSMCGDWCGPAFMALNQLIYTPEAYDKGLAASLFPGEREIHVALLRKLQEKIKGMLKAKKLEVPIKIYPLESEGLFKGEPVSLKSYSWINGAVELHPLSEKGRELVYQSTNFELGLSPLVYHRDFTITKMKASKKK